MAKDRISFAKRQREVEKKRKADQKRAKRRATKLNPEELVKPDRNTDEDLGLTAN